MISRARGRWRVLVRNAKGNRVAIVTLSGGGGILAADAISAQGLSVPELSSPTQSAIRQMIPSYGSANNPIDITAQAIHSGGLQKTIDMLCNSAEADVVLAQPLGEPSG